MDKGTLMKDVLFPGPIYDNRRYGGCAKPMKLKATGDSSDKLVWRCRRIHKCIRQDNTYVTKDVKVSIRHMSWLVDCKISLSSVIELLYCWAHQYPTKELIKEVEISNRTYIEWAVFLRDTCLSSVLEESDQIGGPGIEVEIDECKFGRRKYYRGHYVKGKWIFGGREKYDKTKIFMVPVESRDSSTLLPLIEKYIAKGSIIHSDCWKSYSQLSKMGYEHVTVNHSKQFINKETAACTNCIESDWRHAKVSVPRYGIHRGHHEGYLAQFLWHRKNSHVDKFLKIISDINKCFMKKYFEKLPE